MVDNTTGSNVLSHSKGILILYMMGAVVIKVIIVQNDMSINNYHINIYDCIIF